MKVTTSCEHCKKKFQVPEEYIGKRGKCPACQQVFTARPIGVEETARREDTRPAPPPATAPYERPKPAVAPPGAPAERARPTAPPKREAPPPVSVEPEPEEEEAPWAQNEAPSRPTPAGKRPAGRARPPVEEPEVEAEEEVPEDRPRGRGRGRGREADEMGPDVKVKNPILLRLFVFLLCLTGAGAAGFFGYKYMTEFDEPDARKKFELGLKLLQALGQAAEANKARLIADAHELVYPFLFGAAGLGLLGGIFAFIRIKLVAFVLLVFATGVPAYFMPASLIFTFPFILAAFFCLFLRSRKGLRARALAKMKKEEEDREEE